MVGRQSEPMFLMKYEPVLHLSVAEAREALGFSGVAEMDVKQDADIWVEYVARAIDPRVMEPDLVAA